MSKDLLLEIGTEEVPAHAMPGILAELKEHAATALDGLRLHYTGIRTLGTPRRSALIVEGLDEMQPDITTERRGPSVAVAYDADGKLTKAAQGFARGAKVAPEALVARDGYLYATLHEEGQPTEKLLETVLPSLICGLSFPNNMRWADRDFKFIRPLRWIVALYDDAVIPFTVADVAAGRNSRGHRFLGHESFAIACAGDYEAACAAEFILVDPEKRTAEIRKQIAEVASRNGGTAEISEELLEEVVYLVEYPTALCGAFEEKYLALPPEAVITPMRDHQRYFPVKDADGKLMPLFITVRNGGKEHLDIVQHGNERVLRARLADAQFFFDEDRKKSLAAHREKLKTVVFQEGLGTVYEKTERLVVLAGEIADALCVDATVKAQAQRAALLSKADLVTGMVTEFTELQGTIGCSYARLDGEDDVVAQAIDEHYMPRFAGDAVPQTVPGRIVSLADKIDNIVATFSRGLIPTGSQDPFALRRQALGLVLMLIESQYSLSLSKIVETSMTQFGITDADARAKMQADVEAFLRLRMKNVFDEAQIRYDIADAVLTEIDDVYAVYLRAQAVAREIADAAFAPTLQAFVRAGNLAQKDEGAVLDGDAFTLAEEKALYQAYTSAASAVESLLAAQEYVGAIDAMKDLAAPIDAFFDGVMVMDKDDKVRGNRLALLKAIDTLLRKIADFGKIVV